MPNIDPKQHRKLEIHDIDICPPHGWPGSGPPWLVFWGTAQMGRRGPGGGAASVLKIYQTCTAHIIKKHWHFRDRIHWNPPNCPPSDMGGANLGCGFRYFPRGASARLGDVPKTFQLLYLIILYPIRHTKRCPKSDLLGLPVVAPT